MLSIIIPAYNEERLINITLKYLLKDNNLKDCEIIIVCNGCVDNTFTVVSKYVESQFNLSITRNIIFTVLDTPIRSKTNALNIGINSAKSGNIIFIDADIHITGTDVNTLISNLSDENPLSVSPKIQFDFNESSFFVRVFYKVSSQSFYNQYYRLSNVIALSAEGRKRLGVLPEVIADDEYIRRQFLVEEYKIIKNIHFEFKCPKNLKNLLQVLTRVERGNLQLNSLGYYDKNKAKISGFPKRVWLFFPAFILIKVIAKIRAQWQFKKGMVKQWERDESNR